MEWGFIHCVTSQNMVRIPAEHIPNPMAIYVSGVSDIKNTQLCFSEMPFAIEDVDGKPYVSIARPPGPFIWALINSETETLPEKVDMPDKFYNIYDRRTGLIHLVNTTNGNARWWGYKQTFTCKESSEYVNPLMKAINKECDFAPIGETIMNTWYKKCDSKVHLGVISSWNVPCGIAEYTKQILEQCEFPYHILTPYTNQTINEDADNVVRCFDREHINGLISAIQELKIDNLWIHYSYTWFNDKNWQLFLEWCKENNIRYSVFAHSQIKPEHEDIVGEYYSGNPSNDNYIMIAPPIYEPNCKIDKYAIGSFGFAHSHKRFEDAYPFIVSNKKYHYHIWTSIGQGPDAKAQGVAYIDYLYQLARQEGIHKRVHIHVGFKEEKELLDELSKCAVLVLAYKDIPNENQSAAIALMRATGRPIVTSLSPKIKELGDCHSEFGICHAIHDVVRNLSEFEKGALRKKVVYNKKDEAIAHLSNIKPYGHMKIMWRGDLVGVKSFTIVNQKYIEILQRWGAEIALMPDNNDFKMDDEPQFIQDACRVAPQEGMISTGIHFPPLLSYCDAPIGAWETSRCPTTWIDAIGPQFKKLIVISEFVKNAFMYGGFKEDQLAVVPLGVDKYNYVHEKNNINNVSSIEEIDNLERPFTFLNVSWAEPRKGTDILVDAYTRSFRRSDNVVLVLKTTKRNEWLDRTVATFKAKRPNSAPILIVEGIQADMDSIYRCADVFVHPLRGEGFGLPVLEAAAYGIPSIVTKWAGPMDFTNNLTSWYIDYKLVDAEYHHYVEGAKWAQPNVHHLSSLMKHAYNHREDVLSKGFNAFVNSLSYSWENSAHQLINVLQELQHG